MEETENPRRNRQRDIKAFITGYEDRRGPGSKSLRNLDFFRVFS
jgi:hypothetical protein